MITYQYTNTDVAAAAKPTSRIDAMNGETDWTYFSFGAVKTELKPPPASGKARPLKIYGYTQLYAYIKSLSGTIVPAAAPIWMLTSETECQQAVGGSTPTCDSDASAINVVTTYNYGAAGSANTLLLRSKVVDAGTGKLNLRTCYGYDTSGNKIWETSPRAGLPSCS